MQLNMLRFEHPDRACSTGLAIDAFSRAIAKLEKDHPGGTLDDLRAMGHVLLLEWKASAGPGRIRLLEQGKPERVIDVKPGRRGHLQWFPANCQVRLEPESGQGAALFIAPNTTVFQATPASADPVPPVPADPLRAAAHAWFLTGDVGTSSRALCQATTGYMGSHEGDGNEEGAPDTPWDGSDLRRCIQFLDAVPGARANLDRAAALSPQWAALVARLPELEGLYRRAQAPSPSAIGEIRDILDAVRATPRRPSPR